MRETGRSRVRAGASFSPRRMPWWRPKGRSCAGRISLFPGHTYSSLGAESLHPLSPLTTALNYGVIGEDGTVDVRIIYDHRVLDGSTVARALVDLEKVLIGPITQGLLAANASVAPDQRESAQRE